VDGDCLLIQTAWAGAGVRFASPATSETRRPSPSGGEVPLGWAALIDSRLYMAEVSDPPIDRTFAAVLINGQFGMRDIGVARRHQ
jgi:hypothetical protein